MHARSLLNIPGSVIQKIKISILPIKNKKKHGEKNKRKMKEKKINGIQNTEPTLQRKDRESMIKDRKDQKDTKKEARMA